MKTRPDAAPGEYAAEAAGLEWLAEPGALRTPRCSRWASATWRSSGSRRPSGGLDAAGAEELGRGLAR